MKYKYLNDDIIYEEEKSYVLQFLYNSIIGRVILKILTLNVVSKFIGTVLNTRISIPMIWRYKNKYQIDLSKYEKNKYKSFNEFFIRKLKTNFYKSNSEDFIATANSKISYYKISKNLIINVKNSEYSIEELIKDREIIKYYKDGICLIYRLAPSNYHRYIFCDNGTQKNIRKIKGKLHTVNPIAYDKYNVFTENYREVTELNTENFGEILQIEVGALCVGKIVNNDVVKFNKYEEKGHFEFGGSTIIQLIKKDKIIIDNQIINNTKNNIETVVDVGAIIGKKKNIV